jgi:hypothetical protein
LSSAVRESSVTAISDFPEISFNVVDDYKIKPSVYDGSARDTQEVCIAGGFLNFRNKVEEL